MSSNKDSFMEKGVDILLSFKIWVLIFFLVLSFFAINFNFGSQGVVINGITPNSIAEDAGMSFDSNTGLTDFEKIEYVGSNKIETVVDFYSTLNDIEANSTLKIRTSDNPQGYNLIIGDDNDLGISVREGSKSNIRLGIELEGGSRLILKPVTNLSNSEFDLLVNNLQSRLDVYGASGTKVNKLEDAFSNERFVIVESISANKNDIFELIQRQGNFEAKVGNITVFTGENVLRVLNDPSHEFFNGCPQSQGSYTCSYSFSVEIDSKGGDQFFDETKKLTASGGYLSKKVTFLLDSKEITSLNIASSFKYNKITNPQISVSGGAFSDEQKALESAQREMKFLQAILSTQSLPSELDVVQSYSISSSLGQALLENSILVGFVSLLIVSSIIAIRYRFIGIFFGIFVALIGEVLIVFGVASFMKLSIDLAAIGGLIAAIGTGVDDQIIITDEYFRKRNMKITSRKRVKNALYIIMIAYFTTLAAMVPLYFAGLKVLQGFSFMIIIGVTVGVLITRPAYAAYLRILKTSREERKEERGLED